MKNKFIIYLLFIITISITALSSGFLTDNKPTKVYATQTIEQNAEVQNINENSGFNIIATSDTGDDIEIEDPILGMPIIRSDETMSDIDLYNTLLDIYNYDNESSYTQLYSKMFENYTALDLSMQNIISLDGIQLLNLDDLETLNLAKNRIISVHNYHLENMPKLKSLNLFNNLIKSFQLGSVETLENINLSRNMLTEINLYNIASGNINLSLNKIINTNRITLKNPSIKGQLYVSLINNNLPYADNLINKYNNINFELGIQNVGQNTRENDESGQNEFEIESSTKIQVYKFYNNDVSVVAINSKNNEVVFTASEIDEQYIEFSLPVGEYSLEYVDSNNQNIYNITDFDFGAYKPYEAIKVIPTIASYSFNVDGKIYSNYNNVISKPASISFATTDENAKIYYRVNKGEWEEGTEAKLPLINGSYFVESKVVVGEYESKVATLLIRTKSPKSLSGSWAIIILFAIVFIALVGWIVFQSYYGTPKNHTIKKDK